MSLWSERCFTASFWQSQYLTVKKKQKKMKKILGSKWSLIRPNWIRKHFWSDPNCARRGYDRTQFRSKLPLIRQKCARRSYDQTQLRSKSPLIRPKCARIRLWSDFSDQIDFWSDHLKTIVQTVVRSNFLPDPVILVWEHTGVRSTGSDHKPTCVWTSAWIRKLTF